MTHNQLRWSAGGLLFLVAVLLGGAHLCGLAQDPGSRPLSTGALACTEFWLNRYQTLIATFIFGSIALWAGRLLFKQVETQRFDFISRQITDLQNIYAAAWELWRSCHGELSPNFKIRVHGEATALTSLGVYEVKLLNFWEAIQKTREAIVRLETFARRPIGPLETAVRAENLVSWSEIICRFVERMHIITWLP